MNDLAYPESVVSNVEVAAHTLVLGRGTYCVYVTEISSELPPERLPGLSLGVAPGEEGVSIELGRLPGERWLRNLGDAILVRVRDPQVRLLLTSYNIARLDGARPPKIQVQRLDVATSPSSEPLGIDAARADYLVHMRKRGDIAGAFGNWIGGEGQEGWLEGFSIKAPEGMVSDDLEYQAVLGKDWQSPWIQAGEFCGSRGMQLPLLGLRINLKNAAAEQFVCTYSARFANGVEVGPLGSGDLCMLDSLEPVCQLHVTITPATDNASRVKQPQRKRNKVPAGR